MASSPTRNYLPPRRLIRRRLRPGRRASFGRVLFGDAEPSGRLPVTLPWSAAHVPVFTGATPAARRGYGFTPVRWRFPSALACRTRGGRWTRRDTGDRGAAGRSRPHTGDYSQHRPQHHGAEVVQLYHRDCCCRQTRPARELVAWQKVFLDPGEENHHPFTIPAEQLGWYDRHNTFQQDPGQHHLWVTTGADPLGGEELMVTVTG